MKKTRFLSLALTGTLCVSLLAGCGGSGDGGGAAQTPDAANTSAVQENTGSAFKLGGTGPLTGDAAIYGLAAQRGAQLFRGQRLDALFGYDRQRGLYDLFFCELRLRRHMDSPCFIKRAF